MSLYLVESTLHQGIKTESSFKQAIAMVEAQLGKQQVSLIEVQVSADFARAFFIFESEEQGVVTSGLRELGIPVVLIKPVRLVGQELEELKNQTERVNYLVEWNLPEKITMDQYLERKRTNSVHYAEVPEIAFARTYVCEDMTKCLCFYDAPDEATVKRAREAVKAPIDSITQILPNQ